MVFGYKAVDDSVIFYPNIGVKLQIPVEFQSLKEAAIDSKDDNGHNWIQPWIIPVDDQAKIKIINKPLVNKT